MRQIWLKSKAQSIAGKAPKAITPTARQRDPGDLARYLISASGMISTKTSGHFLTLQACE